MLLLDPIYSFNFKLDPTPLEIKYETLSGSDWPIFENFWEDYKNSPSNIINEIESNFQISELLYYSKEKFDGIKYRSSPNEKIEYIKNYVYGKYRTWQNWIVLEKKFRYQFDNLIYMGHASDLEFDVVTDSEKIITSYIDPELSLRAYIKFNSSLGLLSIEDFIKFIEHSNNSITEFANKKSNVLLINSGLLFNETLDVELYNQVTSWFNLGNYYNEANELHQHWFHLHKRAEVEMVNYLQDLFNGE